MPKQRVLDNTSEWGKKKRREMNKERELQAKYEIYLDKVENREKLSDFVNDPLQMNVLEKKLLKHFKECKNAKKSKKKLLFITLNYDEKLVTPTGTVDYVHKIIHHPKVTKYYASWEWRDNEAETGLHTHIILIGEDTRRITEYCKRQKGPFTKLCSEYHTIKKYPINYWEDKIRYLEGDTNTDEKNELKKGYQRLREKYKLPTLKSI
jgi:hypothetical protein